MSDQANSPGPEDARDTGDETRPTPPPPRPGTPTDPPSSGHVTPLPPTGDVPATGPATGRSAPPPPAPPDANPTRQPMWAPEDPASVPPGPPPTTRQPSTAATRTTVAPTAAVPPTVAPPPGSPWQQPGPAPRPAPPRPPRMREHWNWAAGAVIAQFVVVAALTALSWAARSRGPTLSGVSTSDLTVGGVLVSGAAGIALLGAVLLAGRSAVVPALFALLAGLVAAGGFLIEPINSWRAFTDAAWEAQVNWVVPAAVPIVLGFVALGLRRLARPHAID